MWRTNIYWLRRGAAVRSPLSSISWRPFAASLSSSCCTLISSPIQLGARLIGLVHNLSCPGSLIMRPGAVGSETRPMSHNERRGVYKTEWQTKATLELSRTRRSRIVNWLSPSIMADCLFCRAFLYVLLVRFYAIFVLTHTLKPPSSLSVPQFC